MASQTITQKTPEQWFADYAASGAYGMLSLTDYIAHRHSGGTMDSYEISVA